MVEENNTENQQQANQQPVAQQPTAQQAAAQQPTTQQPQTDGQQQATQDPTAQQTAAQQPQAADGQQQAVNPSSNEEQIGFHKGSLATLAKEREELSRIVGIVEQLMQMHIKSLKDLGVDLQQQADTTNPNPQNNKPIEDLVN